MTKPHQAEHLLVISLNNFPAIEAAYGADAAGGAVDHLTHAARRHLGRINLRDVEGGQITLTARYPLMRSLPVGRLGERLCEALDSEPFRYEGRDILLSVSAGHAATGEGEARARLTASSLHQGAIAIRPGEATAFYRKDMAQAAALLHQVQDGTAFIRWRPVSRAEDNRGTLYHEATLTGDQADCATSYAALERLGLAHLIDRLLVRDVLCELEGDPTACLSVALSPQSLSLNLHGEAAGWGELLDRLRQAPQVARRLVIEISDHSDIILFRDALAFVRTLRALGVRISVSRFGSGRASVGQLMALSPDMGKLDSPFLHTACASESNRSRVAYLLGLARTMTSTVIVDGAESSYADPAFAYTQRRLPPPLTRTITDAVQRAGQGTWR
ncbi:EAL domain-containing protein [Sphingobium sp. TomTYG75]